MVCRSKLPFLLCSLSRVCLLRLRYVFQSNWKMSFSSSTDALLDNLVIEAGSKRELSLTKYFGKSDKCPLSKTNIVHHNEAKAPMAKTDTRPNHVNNLLSEADITYLVEYLEKHVHTCRGVCVPNDTINYLLVYFAKNGHVSGVKAVQIVVKKYNISHFTSQSEYKHFLAEALWMNGKVEDSFNLFIIAYGNSIVKHKVKQMLKCLIPLVISNHGPVVMHKTVNFIKELSLIEGDKVLIGYLWKELFQSNWFSDQQLGKQLLQQNPHLVEVIKWMIPSIGKHFLMHNRTDDFYRLIELTLENNLKKNEEMLVRLLFDHYYKQRNMKRCSEVVKYANNGECPLTEEQQRRYIELLLQSKDSKTNIAVSKSVRFKF